MPVVFDYELHVVHISRKLKIKILNNYMIFYNEGYELKENKN